MLGSDASERIKVCRDGGAELRWIELVTVIAGVILCLAGLVLTIRRLGRRHGLIHQQACPRSARYVEAVGDLASQAVVFGGVALIQFGNVAQHISEWTVPANLWLSFVSSTMVFVLFGVVLGRLHMRWQLRGFLSELDMESTRS
jgi:hypothetical protein